MSKSEAKTQAFASVVRSESFEAERHYYNKVLNSQRHPLVEYFLSLNNNIIAKRYSHLHPQADMKELLKMFQTPQKYFRWAGADLFSVTDDNGKKQMVIIETNSCPSGNKSLPLKGDYQDDDTNYHKMLQKAFWPAVKEFAEKEGVLAVIYDKNPMEATAYAAALADISEENVYIATFMKDEKDPAVKVEDSRLHVRTSDGKWLKVRAAFRYVTQKPWNRLPPLMDKTYVFNPIVCCLAGGRNKMCADKAYEFFNHKNHNKGITIRTPVTIRDVFKREVPIWVKSMGGCAVVKNPYSNAGQGVYTICSKEELDAFMAEDHQYSKFIVQSLVGNSGWSSNIMGKKYYHTGTIPNRQGHSFCADLRMMVCNSKKGFKPVSMYARRAARPLTKEAPKGMESWGMLGTNLSQKTDGKWTTDTHRLLLMDSRDFNRLGLGLDDLIDAYVQTVAAVTAIDTMATELTKSGNFDKKLYSSINADKRLLEEIMEK
jgi:hypothetical protein